MARLDQIDRRKLGERLRLARTMASLTQEQVGASLDLSRTTVTAIERGDRQVSPQDLVAFAKLYGVSVNNLLRDSSVHVDLVAQFRRNLTVPKHGNEGVDCLRLLHRLATACAELERRLGKPLNVHLPPEQPIGRGKMELQAEDMALEVRASLGLGIAPIANIVQLLELEVGLRIFVRRDMPSSISGVFTYHPEIGACVMINGKHPRARRVWTLAHEFAHLLTDRNGTEVCCLEEGKPLSERFSDAFAAAFLMPGVAIRRAFQEAVDAAGKFSVRAVVLMAHRFGVSIEAMFRRLEQIGLLKHGTFEARKRQFPPDLERSIVGDSVLADHIELPPRLSLLAAEAHARGILTEEQIADMLSMERLEVREFLDALEPDLSDTLDVSDD